MSNAEVYCLSSVQSCTNKEREEDELRRQELDLHALRQVSINTKIYQSQNQSVILESKETQMKSETLDESQSAKTT